MHSNSTSLSLNDTFGPWNVHPAPFVAVSVRWPSLATLLRHMNTRPSNIGRRLTVSLGFMRSYVHRRRFEAQVQTSPIFGGLQRHGAEAFTPLFRAFLDKRFGMRERFAVYGQSVSGAADLLSDDSAQAIGRGERLPVVRVGDLVVELGINEMSMEEGLWALTLRDAGGHRLSNVSFSFLPGGRLLIGAVQGPKMNDSAALEGIRAATHALQGLRPPHFVMAVLKCLAREGGLQLLGIDPAVKARLRRLPWSKAYHFDYRGFWQEQGGTPLDSSYWQLGTSTEVRAPEDVPSKKRAMYRRRGELIAALAQQVRPFLAADAAAAAAPAVSARVQA